MVCVTNTRPRAARLGAFPFRGAISKTAQAALQAVRPPSPLSGSAWRTAGPADCKPRRRPGGTLSQSAANPPPTPPPIRRQLRRQSAANRGHRPIGY
mmetsp:Transcript_66701/g.177527  ORF Transcript_66701/g.177527 Transcript_66701/m.177527 type:complete len:97 (-) Transcript_66701:1058-1348(-)